MGRAELTVHAGHVAAMLQTARADFQLLHVSILREYLQIELCQDFYNASIPVNLERVIDDFVFMTFLVGNDFLPHLPSLDISEGAFDRLFGVYKEQAFRIVQSEGRPLSEAYLTMHGEVPNLGRLETFLAAIGAIVLFNRSERAAAYGRFGLAVRLTTLVVWLITLFLAPRRTTPAYSSSVMMAVEPAKPACAWQPA